MGLMRSCSMWREAVGRERPQRLDVIEAPKLENKCSPACALIAKGWRIPRPSSAYHGVPCAEACCTDTATFRVFHRLGFSMGQGISRRTSVPGTWLMPFLGGSTANRGLKIGHCCHPCGEVLQAETWFVLPCYTRPGGAGSDIPA